MAGHVFYPLSPPYKLFPAPGIEISTNKIMVPGERRGTRHKKRRMKTKQSSEDDSNIQADQFSATDFEVSKILLLLSVPLVNAKSFGCPVSVGWGTKRERSDSGSNRPLLSLQSSAPSYSVSEPKCGFERPPPATDKVVALSPATPLAFFTSESEDNPKPLSRKASVTKFIFSQKRKKSEGFVDGLTERRISVNVINVEVGEGKTQPEFASLKPGSSPVRVETRDYLRSMLQVQTVDARRSDKNGQAVRCPFTETSSPSHPTCGFGEIDLNSTTLGIPDLNIAVPDSFPLLDLSLSLDSQGRGERN